jgi:hypothetical protein
MLTDNQPVLGSISVTSIGTAVPLDTGSLPAITITSTLPSIAVGEPSPGGRVRVVVGTEADDTLTLEGGSTAVGGGGSDVYALVSNGVDNGGAERLGVILDYDASNDSLDLSQLGPNASIVSQDAIKGGARIGIDYDGDGKEDGFVLAYAPGPNGEPATILPEADDTGFTILPFPVPGDDGVFTILPFPMPGDDGVVTILPYPVSGDDEVFTIQPYPMPGDDGVFTILPYPMPGDGAIALGQVMDIGVAIGNLDGWSV